MLFRSLDPVKVSAIVREMNKTLYQVDQASMRGPLEMQSKAIDPTKKATEKKAGKKPPQKKPEQKKDDKKKDVKKKDDKKKEEEKKSSSSSGTIKVAKTVGDSLSQDLIDFLKGLEKYAVGAVNFAREAIHPEIPNEKLNEPLYDLDIDVNNGKPIEKGGTDFDKLLEETPEIPTEAKDREAGVKKATDKTAATTNADEKRNENEANSIFEPENVGS